MKSGVLMAAVVGLGLGSAVFAAVEPTAFRVEESRSAAFAKDHVGHPRDGLGVVLLLKGPEAEGSLRFGGVKLEEAVDDQGTNLIPKADALSDPAKYQEYANSFFRKIALEQKQPVDAPQVRLDLSPAKRSATKIARLRGSLQLATAGTTKVVECGGLKTAAKKKLELPAGAGLEITVSVKPGADARSISLEITGDENALESIEVLSSGGQKVSSGMSSFSFNGGPVQKSLDLMQPLDDSMKLVAKIAVDRKIIPVKFDLKDIALP